MVLGEITQSFQFSDHCLWSGGHGCLSDLCSVYIAGAIIDFQVAATTRVWLLYLGSLPWLQSP